MVCGFEPVLEKAQVLFLGREVAQHQDYSEKTAQEIDAEVKRIVIENYERSKKLLEDLTGARVRGYRAPSFSITDWSIPILQELGFEYDSSAFPTVAHDRYGKLTGMAFRVPTSDVSVVDLTVEELARLRETEDVLLVDARNPQEQEVSMHMLGPWRPST